MVENISPPFNKFLAQYRKASKKERGEILNNFEKVYGRSRKSLIRSFNRLLGYHGGKKACEHTRRHSPGRPLKYGKDVTAAIEEILEAYNFPGADRFYSSLAEAVRILSRDGDWKYTTETTNSLLQMSLGTFKTRVAKISRARGLMRGFSTTRSSNIMREVPIFTGSWQEVGPGYCQIDTVVHSGPRLEGNMVYTVNVVDVATYWQEFRAQLNKGELATRNSLMAINNRLPFNLHGIHPDSGSEFINRVLKTWCDNHDIELTRSRPSKKNDNCYIEQRNDSTVRRYLGYGRYDCMEAVSAMNKLYDVLRLYINFFQPTTKLLSKTKLQNGKWHYERDKAKTPYQRVLELPDHIVSPETKQTLKAQYETLNPKQLLATIQTSTIKLEQTQKAQGYHF